MYRYNFECDKILLEIVDNLVSLNDKIDNVNIIITEKYLLLFKNVKEESVLKIKGVSEMPEYELLIELDLNNLNYEIDENNTLIKLGDNELIIYNLDLNAVKK